MNSSPGSSASSRAVLEVATEAMHSSRPPTSSMQVISNRLKELTRVMSSMVTSSMVAAIRAMVATNSMAIISSHMEVKAVVMLANRLMARVALAEVLVVTMRAMGLVLQQQDTKDMQCISSRVTSNNTRASMEEAGGATDSSTSLMGEIQ